MKAWTGYKETTEGSNKAFKVNRYYHTPRMPQEDLRFTVDRLNMNAVYESLVRQISGDKLQANTGESLKQSIACDEKKKLLGKQIAALESKIRKEKQLNRQMKMNAELKKLRKKPEGLQN